VRRYEAGSRGSRQQSRRYRAIRQRIQRTHFK